MDILVWLGALRAKKSSARASVKGDERKKEKEDRMGERSNEGNVRGVAGGFRSPLIIPLRTRFPLVPLFPVRPCVAYASDVIRKPNLYCANKRSDSLSGEQLSLSTLHSLDNSHCYH